MKGLQMACNDFGDCIWQGRAVCQIARMRQARPANGGGQRRLRQDGDAAGETD